MALKLDLGFVLDLLHLDDHEFSRQGVARLSRSQDRTTDALSSVQVKDLVLDNMVITLGARQTVEWLSTIARRLLRPLPLKALTVLTHAFLPQLTYEGETAIASQPFVSKASLDGMEVTATAIACGQEFLHEFLVSFPVLKGPHCLLDPIALSFLHNHFQERMSAGLNHRQHGGSTEATGSLFLSTADAIVCDVGCFVKKTQGCTQEWHRTQIKGLQVMLLPGVNLSIRHLLPAGWEVMPGIPSAMLTPSDTVLQVAAMVKVGKTLGGSQLLNIAIFLRCITHLCWHSTTTGMRAIHRGTSGCNH